ncbi:MAG: aldo/keto reductase [Acidobacteria bacterium]|nr:aldo/keto reductase [Acidobacteriota bacterium]
MDSHQSRRQFLQAGLALPAVGLVSSGGFNPEFQGSAGAPKVVYRTLGKTGLKVTGVGYGIGFVPVPEVVARAIDMGVNYYDTSRDYGESEKIFSGVIKGKRDKIVIASKSGRTKKEHILEDLDTTLQVLGTDHVDIWHLHGRDNPTQIPDEAVEAMEICKQSGKARFIGFSCHDINNMVPFILKTGKFDVIQTTYSFPIGGRYREQAIAKLHEAGIGVIAMKVVVALSGFNLKTVENPPARPNGDGPVAGIKWVLQNPAIGTTVPNMRTVPQLEMNFRAMSEPYTPADERLLTQLNERIRPDYCRMCYQCKGVCPKGLPVADMLRFLSYHDLYGDYHRAVVSFKDLQREVRDVRCSDCAVCTIRCPNGVQVQDSLIRAQRLLA